MYSIVLSRLWPLEHHRPMALRSGLFYELNEMVYPQAVVLEHLYTFVRNYFEIITWVVQ